MITAALPTFADPPAYYRLEIPTAGHGWITLNQRGHWGKKARLTRHYRHAGQVFSLHARLPRLDSAHVVCELKFSTAYRRDPHNWMPTAKAVLDGMVDAGVFPDDNHKHIVGPDMRIGAKVPRGSEHLVMHVWPGVSEPVSPISHDAFLREVRGEP